MRRLVATALFTVLPAVSGLGLTACDQDGGGNSEPGSTPTAPGQTVPGGNDSGGGLGS